MSDLWWMITITSQLNILTMLENKRKWTMGRENTLNSSAGTMKNGERFGHTQKVPYNTHQIFRTYGVLGM